MSDFKVWSFLVQRPDINITLMVDLAIHAYVEPVYDKLDMSLLVSTWIKAKQLDVIEPHMTIALLNFVEV